MQIVITRNKEKNTDTIVIDFNSNGAGVTFIPKDEKTEVIDVPETTTLNQPEAVDSPHTPEKAEEKELLEEENTPDEVDEDDDIFGDPPDNTDTATPPDDSDASLLDDDELDLGDAPVETDVDDNDDIFGTD